MEPKAFLFEEGGSRRLTEGVTQKTVNGVKHDYYYEDGQLIYEAVEGAYELHYKYDLDGTPVSVTRFRYADSVVHKRYVKPRHG